MPPARAWARWTRGGAAAAGPGPRRSSAPRVPPAAAVEVAAVAVAAGVARGGPAPAAVAEVHPATARHPAAVDGAPVRGPRPRLRRRLRLPRPPRPRPLPR